MVSYLDTHGWSKWDIIEWRCDLHLICSSEISYSMQFTFPSSVVSCDCSLPLALGDLRVHWFSSLPPSPLSPLACFMHCEMRVKSFTQRKFKMHKSASKGSKRPTMCHRTFLLFISCGTLITIDFLSPVPRTGTLECSGESKFHRSFQMKSQRQLMGAVRCPLARTHGMWRSLLLASDASKQSLQFEATLAARKIDLSVDNDRWCSQQTEMAERREAEARAVRRWPFGLCNH